MALSCGLLALSCQAQTFSLEHKTDSLYLLTLTTDSTSHQWRLPYPVYRMETGDVDGNGTTEALVGVIKPTRFHPEMGRRLFIFKNYEGLSVRSLETNAQGQYTVAEYSWSGFGVAFERYLVKNVDETTAREIFE